LVFTQEGLKSLESASNEGEYHTSSAHAQTNI
jgi:hypothetical protein